MSTLSSETLQFNATPSSDLPIVYRYLWERYLVAALLLLGTILGSTGNSLVIVAVALSKKLKTPTNVFVVNLAVADVINCLFTPWQVLAILGKDNWPMPKASWLCTATSFVTIVSIGSSVNNLALIAVNRWVGITKSRYTTRRFYTARRIGLMVIFAWTLPLGCALIPVLTDFGQLGYEKLYSTCTWDRSNPYSFLYNILIACIIYPLQLIITLVCYSSIFCYVSRVSRKMTRADAPTVSAKISGGGNQAMRKKLWKRQLDVTKNLLYIVLAFLVCISPYFVTIISSSDWSYRLVPWSAVILFYNSSINPLIYATSHPDFKKAFRFMVKFQQIPRGASTRRSTTNPTNLNSTSLTLGNSLEK